MYRSIESALVYAALAAITLVALLCSGCGSTLRLDDSETIRAVYGADGVPRLYACRYVGTDESCRPL
jgi:hypothetical protein